MEKKDKEKMKRLRLSISEEAYKMLEELCYIEVGGEMRAQIDILGTLARECLLRGLREVYLERKKIKEKLADASARGEPA